jgi:hypothetical protein
VNREKRILIRGHPDRPGRATLSHACQPPNDMEYGVTECLTSLQPQAERCEDDKVRNFAMNFDQMLDKMGSAARNTFQARKAPSALTSIASGTNLKKFLRLSFTTHHYTVDEPHSDAPASVGAYGAPLPWQPQPLVNFLRLPTI